MSLFDQYPVTIHNSLSRKKETFEPLVEGHVGMYVCGPTVYNDVHIGNVRSFVSFDVVFRYLKHLGYKVRYVRNITDVGHLQNDADSGEDKIARQARLLNLEPMEVVQHYTYDFHKVMARFNTLPPSIEPTATGHIIEQIELVQKILDAGFAYEVNGSVYFDVRKYNESNDYGELSGRVIDDLLSETRELASQDEKHESLDFAIWKKADESHIMQWNSPWGKGFPGWHLECSVMSTKYLGETFDIHGGGMDLLFPHHECEIAQAKAGYGKEPVRYWMHGNMLTMNGQKMSKSLGNVFTPHQLITGDSELLDQAYSPMTVRFFFLQAHYRSTLDFSNEALKAAETGLHRLRTAAQNLAGLKHTLKGVDEELDNKLNELCDQCYREMSDDFNTAKAIAVLFEMGSIINSFKDGHMEIGSVTTDTFERFKSTFNAFMYDVLGLSDEEEGNSEYLDKVMDILIDLRKQARADKNFELSDKIRDDLQASGIVLKDEKDGSTSYSIN